MTPSLVQAVCALAVLCLQLPLIVARPSPRAIFPIPPTEDPFYKPPKDYKSKAPGTILRHRVMPSPLVPWAGNTTTNFKIGYQILYRTTDALGDAQATVTTLLVPQNASEDKLLSYQTAEDSAFLNCAPSYGIEQGAVNGSTSEVVTIAAALYQGWYVSVPDYEGPNSAFAVGPQAAHATLDNIRAVLQSGSFSKLCPTARAVMWGYSGGALATEWAAEFLSSYAPELESNVVGAAAGGLTPNVTSTLLTVNGGPNAALIPSGLLGFANAYPNMSRYLDAHLVPSTAAEFRTPLSACLDAAEAIFAGKNMFAYFKNGMGILKDPVLLSVIDVAGIMGLRGTPSIPLYFYKALGDEESVIADTDALYAKYCADGASIQYQRNRFGEHITDYILGAHKALTWLKDRLDGKEISAQGCSERTVTVKTVRPGDVTLFGEAVYEFLVEELAYELKELGLD